jgi:hypothetical protein
VGDLAVPIIIVAALIALLVLVVGGFILRRYVLTRPVGTFDCSMRRNVSRSTGGWVLGVARYEDDRLDWFRVFAISPRPGRTLARSRLVVLDRRNPGRSDSFGVVPNGVIVSCGYGASVLELSMSDAAYNGFAAWLESAPPSPPLFAPQPY